MKGALRKKHQPLQDALDDAAVMKASKKRSVDAHDDNLEAPATKRAKVEPQLLPSEARSQKKSDSDFFRPLSASGRARKQYRGKKARTASSESPTARLTRLDVDYDAIPDLPASSARDKPGRVVKVSAPSRQKKVTTERPEAASVSDITTPVVTRKTRSEVKKSKEPKATRTKKVEKDEKPRSSHSKAVVNTRCEEVVLSSDVELVRVPRFPHNSSFHHSSAFRMKHLGLCPNIIHCLSLHLLQTQCK